MGRLRSHPARLRGHRQTPRNSARYRARDAPPSGPFLMPDAKLGPSSPRHNIHQERRPARRAAWQAPRDSSIRLRNAPARGFPPPPDARCKTRDFRACLKTSTSSLGPPDAQLGRCRALTDFADRPSARQRGGKGGCVIKCINPMRRYNQPDRHGIFMTDQIRCSKVVSVPFVMRKTRVHFPAADAKAKTVHKTTHPELRRSQRPCRHTRSTTQAEGVSRLHARGVRGRAKPTRPTQTPETRPPTKAHPPRIPCA